MVPQIVTTQKRLGISITSTAKSIPKSIRKIFAFVIKALIAVINSQYGFPPVRCLANVTANSSGKTFPAGLDSSGLHCKEVRLTLKYSMKRGDKSVNSP